MRIVVVGLEEDDLVAALAASIREARIVATARATRRRRSRARTPSCWRRHASRGPDAVAVVHEARARACPSRSWPSGPRTAPPSRWRSEGRDERLRRRRSDDLPTSCGRSSARRQPWTRRTSRSPASLARAAPWPRCGRSCGSRRAPRRTCSRVRPAPQGGRRARHPSACRARARPFSFRSLRGSPRDARESDSSARARRLHRRGAGASGRLRLADGGTLFLDEIEDLTLALQAKLLRVVHGIGGSPLGASTSRRVDVRIVAASNPRLCRWSRASASGATLLSFRRVTIRLPPLRDHRDDLPGLVAHFVGAFMRGTDAFPPPGPHVCRPSSNTPCPATCASSRTNSKPCLTMAHATGTDLGQALRRVPSGRAASGTDERTRLLRVPKPIAGSTARRRGARHLARHAVAPDGAHQIRDPLGPVAETG